MKKIAVAITMLCSISAVFATPVYHPPGPNLTYGAVSNGQTIMSDITNPAAGAAAMERGEGNFRFGIISSFGVGFEWGSIDNIFDEIDQQVDQFYDAGATFDPNNADAEIAQQIDSLNSLLSRIEADGYGKAFASGHIPLMPIVVTSDFLGGSLVFDMNYSVASRAEVLHQTINFTTVNDNSDDIVVDIPNSEFTVNNDSTLLVRAAAILEGALGYSRKVMQNAQGNLYAGVRGKFLRVGLTQLNVRFGNVDDAEDIFEDIGDEDFTDDTGVGIDLGVLWKSTHYRVGATINNINEPEFEYNAVSNSADYAPNSPVLSRINAMSTYTMESQISAEGALFSENQNWVIAASLDVNAAKDPFGDEYQWLAVSAAYATDSWIIPGLRVGYRSNLSGSELSYLTGGFTLFKVINMDFAYGLDEVEIEGESAPRSFIFNIGLEMSF